MLANRKDFWLKPIYQNDFLNIHTLFPKLPRVGYWGTAQPHKKTSIASSRMLSILFILRKSLWYLIVYEECLEPEVLSGSPYMLKYFQLLYCYQKLQAFLVHLQVSCEFLVVGRIYQIMHVQYKDSQIISYLFLFASTCVVMFLFY